MSERSPFSIVYCEHWNASGLPCKKGVNPADVIDDQLYLPCVEVRGVTGKVACDLRVMPSSSPAAPAGRMTKLLSALVSGKCPTCDGPINGEMEFNGAILALPCRHLLRTARD